MLQLQIRCLKRLGSSMLGIVLWESAPEDPVPVAALAAAARTMQPVFDVRAMCMSKICNQLEGNSPEKELRNIVDAHSRGGSSWDRQGL